MASGDGWLLRVRVPGGRLPLAASAAIAEVASRHGVGVVEVTSRANLQVRGVAEAQVAAAAAGLVAAGLASGDVALDALGAVVASPLAGHDPSARGDSDSVVTAYLDHVGSVAGHGSLGVPAKFGVVVDDGGSWPLGGLDADVRAVAEHRGWSVHLRGERAAVAHVDDPTELLVEVARLCATEGERVDRLVARDRAAVAAALGSGGLFATAQAPRASRSAGPRGRAELVPAGRRLGVLPGTDGRVNLVVAPFLGLVAAEDLVGLGAVAVEHGVELRTTPDRSFALCGLAPEAAPTVAERLARLGFVVDQADGRGTVSACIGAPGCASAHADTSAAAIAFAQLEDAGRVHLSGCAKACGAPAGVRHLVADPEGRFR